MCSLQASLFSLQVSATMVPMPSVKLSNCALSVEVGERFLGIGLCEYVAHCIMVPSFFCGGRMGFLFLLANCVGNCIFK